ncbi:MAG: signal recognition particle-docking protein FtsY [Clostridia bacterium]|nr:signal recognition particle-docking protein FtsY [Clostridia bacterium]
MAFFEKLKNGLFKTKQSVMGRVDSVLRNFVSIDDDLMDELEEVLITSDMGMDTVETVMDALRESIKDNRAKDPSDIRDLLKAILREQIGDGAPLDLSTKPSVVLVIGVNGVGKTTTIGKLASHLRADGKSVILAAADTFRAAAIDQLAVWADRADVPLIRQSEGSDPAAVVFDAAAAARKRGADVLLVDTAGRLHNKKNLMDELAKIDRVLSRELPDAARETLLVLDATTGQNALQQAKEFMTAAKITGLVLTKLDGTAKGGAVFSIKKMLGIPVKYIGVGEQADDLQPFDPDAFVDALFS